MTPCSTGFIINLEQVNAGCYSLQRILILLNPRLETFLKLDFVSFRKYFWNFHSKYHRR